MHLVAWAERNGVARVTAYRLAAAAATEELGGA
jgi:hypothetical protein